MFTYCPSCADRGIAFDGKNRFFCRNCGFTYYQNTAATGSLVVNTESGILLLVRGSEPGRGKLGLPGGFIDPGEGVIEGLRRECREEIGWDCGERVAFFASFPNVYPYKGVVYHTCDMFFSVAAGGLTEKDLSLQAGETSGCRFIPKKRLRMDELAFDSAKRALRTFCAMTPFD
jgi:ADP-ribose pyrophosphatase YjhB (NUDIX family)